MSSIFGFANYNLHDASKLNIAELGFKLGEQGFSTGELGFGKASTSE
jgi:hypothetical protein